MYLCNKIAHRNFKFFLSKKKKYKLAEKYIALKYLDKINFNKYASDMPRESKDVDYNTLLDDVKDKIMQDIEKISTFYKESVDSISFKLNEIYELFKDVQKFDELIKSIKNMDLKDWDEKLAEEFLEGITFIFDVAKISSPIHYAVYYTLQYIFWEIVVVGGLLVDMKLSAALMQKSLVNFGEEGAKEIEITDEETTDLVKNNDEFKRILNDLIKNKDSIELNNYKTNFVEKDLYLSLHGVTLDLIGNKNNDNTWNLKVELTDVYDFTDFKSLGEYATAVDSIPMSIFATILNNLAVVSSEYGVIKPYTFTMKFELNNYEVNEVNR